MADRSGVIYDCRWRRRNGEAQIWAQNREDFEKERTLKKGKGGWASRKMEAFPSKRGIVCWAGVLSPTWAEKKKLLGRVANFLIALSFVGLVFLFGPVARAEIGYQIKKAYDNFFVEKENNKVVHFNDLLVNQSNQGKLMVPEADFALIIPKIDLKTRVIANVNPDDEKEYRAALMKGVAHAAGTVFPGMKGNIYLFAHSTDFPWNISKYNAVFYLLSKLEAGDEIVVYFYGGQYRYQVTEKKIVEPTATDYLTKQVDREVLVLQTCWPPGTTQKRLLVFAERKV